MNKEGFIANLAERLPDLYLHDGESNNIEIVNCRVINMPDNDKMIPFLELKLKESRTNEVSFLLLKVL